jgi:hypothetical protein
MSIIGDDPPFPGSVQVTNVDLGTSVDGNSITETISLRNLYHRPLTVVVCSYPKDFIKPGEWKPLSPVRRTQVVTLPPFGSAQVQMLFPGLKKKPNGSYIDVYWLWNVLEPLDFTSIGAPYGKGSGAGGQPPQPPSGWPPKKIHVYIGGVLLPIPIPDPAPVRPEGGGGDDIRRTNKPTAVDEEEWKEVDQARKRAHAGRTGFSKDGRPLWLGGYIGPPTGWINDPEVSAERELIVPFQAPYPWRLADLDLPALWFVIDDLQIHPSFPWVLEQVTFWEPFLLEANRRGHAGVLRVHIGDAHDCECLNIVIRQRVWGAPDTPLYTIRQNFSVRCSRSGGQALSTDDSVELGRVERTGNVHPIQNRGPRETQFELKNTKNAPK